MPYNNLNVNIETSFEDATLKYFLTLIAILSHQNNINQLLINILIKN